ALALRHFVTEREKRELRHVFSKYVSRDVMNEILRDATKVRLGGEEAEATVFFSDVRDFTTLSERLTPTELTHFLNRYFTVMTNITLDRRGVVDKYIGDALMAFWGAPLKNPGHATDAVLAALDMIDALAKFNAENAASGGLAIDIGIGLSSGSVVAGNMGSDQRLDYTVMGDTVNLASRLEGQTKTYGVHIVTSEFTVAKLPEEFLRANNIVVREIDRVRVKGKNLPVTIFEVVERSRQAAVREIAADFDRLRIEYYAGRWAECLTIGRMILARGDDGPTRVLVERAKYFLTDPPANWKGVYDFKTK
ncbi:MAG: adenylate/guanylate cyclase domain-containing protein, partial [Patescibacteria group bacterium]